MKLVLRFVCLFFILLLFQFNSFGQTNDSLRKMVFIRNIILKGNKITKDFVLLREMNIKAGDFLYADEVNKKVAFNKERIMNSQLLLSAESSIKNRKNDSLDIIYTVKELFYWQAHPFVSLADRNFNVWWDDYDHKLSRVNLGADINRKNFRGRGEDVGLEVQAGFNKHVFIYYSNPYIDKSLKKGIKASLAYNTGKEIQAQTDSNKQIFYRDEMRNPYRWFRAEFSFLYRPQYAAIHEFKLSFHHYAITDKMFLDRPDFLGGRKKMNIPEFMYRYRYNNTNDRNYPTAGWELDGYFDQKGMGMVKNFNQYQVYAHVAKYNAFTKNLSSSVHFRGRLFGPDKQPYFNYRAMGYKNDYVRGFEYYIVDGSHYGLVRADLRRKLFSYVFKQDVFPLVKYVPIDAYIKTYGDVGYVHSKNIGNSFLNNKVLSSYGLGLDIVFSYYVKMRIEYSFNSLNEKGIFLHLRNE